MNSELLKGAPPEILRHQEVVAKLYSFKERFDPTFSSFLSQEIKKARTLRPKLGELMEVGAEFALHGGKRLRPAFLYYGYKSTGEKEEEAVIYASMLIELLHAGILIHDDIIDNSELRRGRPTVHRELADRYRNEHLGRSLAIVVGDTLLALANKVLSTAPFSKERLQLARYYFDQMSTEVNLGECLDILGDVSEEVDIDWVMKVMEYKTAKYTVEGPLKIGGALGGASGEILDSFSEYALPLGIAFQLQDDILGMFGDEKKVGKPVDSDLKEGKKTVLVLETLRRLKKEGRDSQVVRFEEILGNPNLTTEDYYWTQQLIRETGALDYSQRLAQDCIKKAKLAFEGVGIEREARDYLLGIADFMLEREY